MPREQNVFKSSGAERQEEGIREERGSLKERRKSGGGKVAMCEKEGRQKDGRKTEDGM